MGEDEHPNRTDLGFTKQDNKQTMSQVFCNYGKACKNIRGLKIHQARKGCKGGEVTTQRTVVSSGETMEELGLEANHNAQNLLVSITPTASTALYWLPHWPAVLRAFTHHQLLSMCRIFRATKQHQLRMVALHHPTPIQWPQSSGETDLHQFDEDVDQILQGTS